MQSCNKRDAKCILPDRFAAPEGRFGEGLLPADFLPAGLPKSLMNLTGAGTSKDPGPRSFEG